jgi:hypothetical protein
MNAVNLICITFLSAVILYADYDFFNLYFIMIPRMLWHRFILWLRLWPRLQLDRWYLKKRYNRVAQDNSRFVKMARELEETLNDSSTAATRTEEGD